MFFDIYKLLFFLKQEFDNHHDDDEIQYNLEVVGVEFIILLTNLAYLSKGCVFILFCRYIFLCMTQNTDHRGAYNAKTKVMIEWKSKYNRYKST